MSPTDYPRILQFAEARHQIAVGALANARKMPHGYGRKVMVRDAKRQVAVTGEEVALCKRKLAEQQKGLAA
jgi:hypothetical protein